MLASTASGNCRWICKPGHAVAKYYKAIYSDTNTIKIRA